MSKLTSCPHCDGFLPHGAAACPLCGATVKSPLSKPLRGVLALGAGSLLAMTLSACYGAPIDDIGSPYCPDPTTDIDGDGYCGSTYDCNESDPTVNFGAVDTEGDGVDSNCDGVDGYAGDAG